MLISPPRASDWPAVAGLWLLVLSVSFALWSLTHEKLSFDHNGIERVSGLRCHRIAYSDIKTVKMQLQQSRGGPVPIVLICTSPGRPPTEIHSYNYEAGELRKMLRILSQQAPQATFNEMARQYLDPH